MGSAKVVVRPALLETQKSGVSNLCSLACTGLGISAGPSLSAGAPVVQGTKPISTARVTARPPQSPRSHRQQTRSSRRSPSPSLVALPRLVRAGLPLPSQPCSWAASSLPNLPLLFLVYCRVHFDSCCLICFFNFLHSRSFCPCRFIATALI